MNRHDALALDAADPLAPLRDQFTLPEGVIYLDGNSLGVLPAGHRGARAAGGDRRNGARGLIRSWNSAGWITLPQRVGDKIARLIGARPGELVVADSTSVNLFKVLSAALSIVQAASPHAARDPLGAQQLPDRPVHRRGAGRANAASSSCWPMPTPCPTLLDDRTAVLMLTHVNYRTGRMHDMAALTRAAHAAGALAVWDLAHSAGAVPVDLHGGERRLRRRLRLQVPERRPRRAGLRLGAPAPCRAPSGSRWPAGWATPRRSPSRPTTGPRPASRATSAARRRC